MHPPSLTIPKRLPAHTEKDLEQSQPQFPTLKETIAYGTLVIRTGDAVIDVAQYVKTS